MVYLWKYSFIILEKILKQVFATARENLNQQKKNSPGKLERSNTNRSQPSLFNGKFFGKNSNPIGESKSKSSGLVKSAVNLSQDGHKEAAVDPVEEYLKLQVEKTNNSNDKKLNFIFNPTNYKTMPARLRSKSSKLEKTVEIGFIFLDRLMWINI